MRILIANLKLLCQSRWSTFCLLAGLLIALCLFPDAVNAEIVLAALVLVPLCIGIAVGMMQDALTSRVGLFCLPRPHGERRRLAFLVGLFVAFGAVLVFAGYADRFDVPSQHDILVVGSVFSASLFCCLLGATASVLAGCLFFCLPMILSVLISLYAPSWPSVSTLLDRAIIHHPVGVIALGMFGVVSSWFRLALPINDLRHQPTRPITADNALQRFFANTLAASERKDAIHPWLSTVLLERMRRSPHAGRAKHVWSTFYLWLHPHGRGRAELIGGGIFGLALMVLAWYTSFALLLILGVAVWLMGHQWPVHSCLMTVGGRRERFLSTMVQLAASGGVLTLSVILSCVALDALQGYLPESEARALEVELGNVPLGLGTAMLTLALVPLGCLAQIALARARQRRDTALWLAMLLMPVMAEFLTVTVSPAGAMIVVVLSWVICAAGVYHIALRGDLVVRGGREPAFSSSWRTICETVAGQQNRGGR